MEYQQKEECDILDIEDGSFSKREGECAEASAKLNHES